MKSLKDQSKFAFLLTLIFLMTLGLTGCDSGSSNNYNDTIPDTDEYSVSGEVQNFRGEGIKNVYIIAENENKRSKTDAEGNWQLDNLSGSVKIIAEKEGYIFDPKTVEVSGKEEIIFTLESEIISGEVSNDGKTNLNPNETEIEIEVNSRAITEDGNTEIPEGMEIIGDISEDKIIVMAFDQNNNYLPEVIIKDLSDSLSINSKISTQEEPITISLSVLGGIKATDLVGGISVGEYISINTLSRSIYQEMVKRLPDKISVENLEELTNELYKRLDSNTLIMHIATEYKDEVLNPREIKIKPKASKEEIKDVLREEFGEDKEIKNLYLPSEYDRNLWWSSNNPRVVRLPTSHIEESESTLNQKVEKIIGLYNETIFYRNDAIKPHLAPIIFHHYDRSKNEYLSWLKELGSGYDHYKLEFWNINYNLINNDDTLVISGKVKEEIYNCYATGNFDMYLEQINGVWKIYRVEPKPEKEFCPQIEGLNQQDNLFLK